VSGGLVPALQQDRLVECVDTGPEMSSGNRLVDVCSCLLALYRYPWLLGGALLEGVRVT
jgi:hypothetical protein